MGGCIIVYDMVYVHCLLRYDRLGGGIGGEVNKHTFGVWR